MFCLGSSVPDLLKLGISDTNLLGLGIFFIDACKLGFFWALIFSEKACARFFKQEARGLAKARTLRFYNPSEIVLLIYKIQLLSIDLLRQNLMSELLPFSLEIVPLKAPSGKSLDLSLVFIATTSDTCDPTFLA